LDRLSAGDLLQAMRGLSPVSAGATEELVELRKALLKTPDALALVKSGTDDAGVLAQLQSRQDAVGRGGAARTSMSSACESLAPMT
jgi:hypothetical protein